MRAVWQHGAMDEGTSEPPRFALDEATIELGRREIERIRAQLRGRHDADHAPTTDATEPAREVAAEPLPSPPARDHSPDAVASDRFSADRIAAEMTAAADRERLEARVDQLESEVGQLRAALGAVMRAAAAGLDAPPPLPDDPAGQAQDLRGAPNVD